MALTLAAVITGCAAATSSSVNATGSTLAIYASAPAQSTAGQPGQDVLDAERLAFGQKQSEVTKFKLKFVVLAGKLSDNARTAITDTSAIAYIGEIAPGASEDSAGITNDQDLLQVSPTDTALGLTQPTPAVPGAPNSLYESIKTYGRTFARLVPNTAREAKALVAQMQALSVSKLYVADDGTDYGKALALGVRSHASPAVTVQPALAGADGVFYAGSSASTAAQFFQHAALTDPNAKLFGPSALDSSALASALGSSTLNLSVSAPGFLPKDVPSAGQKFLTDFKAAYNRTPAPQAIFGYEAVSAVLDVIAEAGTLGSDRSTVVKDFFAIKNRASVLGTYSIDGNGDTNLAPFVFSRLQAGSLVPFKFVQAQG